MDSQAKRHLPDTRQFKAFNVPSRYPVTLCKAMMGGIYHVPGKIGSPVFQQRVGDGTLIHIGIAPAYFSSSAEAADILRAIAAHACEQAGIKYEERKRFGIRRGKYVAMHTLEGEKELTGTYVDLLDPKLSLVTDPKMGPGERALYCDVTSELQGEPKLLYASSKVEEYSASADSLEVSVTGPWKTTGVVRIYTGGKSIGSIEPESVEAVSYTHLRAHET